MKDKNLLKFIVTLLFIFSLLIPFTSSAAEAKISYSKNKKYIYIYEDLTLGNKHTEKFIKVENGLNKWKRSSLKLAVGDPGYFYIYEKENKNGYYYSFDKKISSIDRVLKFPVKKNAFWSTGSGDLKLSYKVTSTNTRIKTKAGTFKNVVEVKSSGISGYDFDLNPVITVTKYYYAPNVGLILEKTDEDYPSGIELVKLTKK